MPINYKEYPPNWKTEIRPAILDRANNKCEWCGIPNYSWIWRHGKGKDDWLFCLKSDAHLKPIRVILTVMHLDHDKENHEVEYDRLKAACQKCHLDYDREHRKSKRKID